MKTLYVRIVIIYVFIALLSSLLALLLSNVYYQNKLQAYHEQKALHVAREIRSLYESTTMEIEQYLQRMGDIGFQFYLVSEHSPDEGNYYGEPFKHQNLAAPVRDKVLRGEIYNGLSEDQRLFSLAGYFENSLTNSIGIPMQIEDERYALFIRPNLQQQIGEIRILLAILIVHSFVFTILFIIISTRIIVKPIQELTDATKQIVNGDYEIELDTNRQDEIGNLAAHFSQMSSALQQLEAMRQEFVANVSHEIQSPLTSIQGFTQTILSNEASPEEAKRYLQIIEEESRRLSSLSKQLLILASLDKEQGFIKKTSFRLDEQLRQVFIANQWLWTEKELQIELQFPEVIVEADAAMLYQVWNNLVTNAIKFSEHGGKIVAELRVEQDIVVRIQDTGIGIPEAELGMIFERFYKADPSRSRAGSGLGLSIVKKIVNLHGGTLEAASQLGQGTTIVVRLPY